jgi:hypothetical protein
MEPRATKSARATFLILSTFRRVLAREVAAAYYGSPSWAPVGGEVLKGPYTSPAGAIRKVVFYPHCKLK